jgi:hypothetical protein
MTVYPVTITVMMACYFSSEPEKAFVSTWASQSWVSARDWLLKEGLIDKGHKSTERGDVWVKAMCTVPLPIEQMTWVIPK